MKQIKLPRGCSVLIGAPANPMKIERSEAISRAVTSLNGISEAHLPQMYVKGVIDLPKQILVVAVDSICDVESILAALNERLEGALMQGEWIDVLPLSQSDALLPSVRGANCKIH